MANDNGEVKKMLLKKMARKEKVLDKSYLDDVSKMEDKVDDIIDEEDTRSDEQKEQDALKKYILERRKRGNK